MVRVDLRRSAMSKIVRDWSRSIGLATSGLLVGLFAGASLADDAASDLAFMDDARPSAQPGHDVAPFQRGMRPREGNGVYKAQITPHWFPQDSGFWYRNDLPGGTTEYIIVDTATGTRGPA